MSRRRSIPASLLRAPVAPVTATMLLVGAVLCTPPGGQAATAVVPRTTAPSGGAPSLSESEYRRAILADPQEASSWLGLARVLEGQGRALEALEAARRALDISPGDLQAALLAARQLARLGADQEALDLLTRVREQAPLEPEATVLASLLLKKTGRFEKAATVLEAAVAAGLSQPEIVEELGLVLLDLDRRRQAEEVAEAGLEDHPASPGLTAVAGLALIGDDNRRAEAVERLRAALDLGFEPAGPIELEIGTLLLEEGDSEAAAAALQRAAELMPESIEAHYRLGRALRSTGDRDGSRAALERFQELSRAHDEAERTAGETGTILNEAQELANSNQLDAALAQVNALLEGHPDQPRAFALKAKILFSKGDVQAALEAIRTARELAPGQVEPHYLEGLFQLSAGSPSKAEVSLRQALSLAPSMGDASALLAMALAKQERFDEAAARFQEALDHGADSPAIRLGYAAALESLGRLDESRRQHAAYESLTGN